MLDLVCLSVTSLQIPSHFSFLFFFFFILEFSSYLPSFSLKALYIYIYIYILLINLFYLFISGCIGSSLLCAGFLQLQASGGYSSLQCTGFSLWWLLLLQSMGSRCAGFSSCGTWAQQLWLSGSRAQAQQLWRTGLVDPRHVRSSRTRT